MIFEGESLTTDDLIASAAVPPLFRAVHADDGHLYWDGLFATNPPVREFTDLDERPDEIWVVQINPQRRDREPRSMREIVDRRNELAGNLSLGQELYLRRQDQPADRQPRARWPPSYKRIQIRVVELDGRGARLSVEARSRRRVHRAAASTPAGSAPTGSSTRARSGRARAPRRRGACACAARAFPPRNPEEPYVCERCWTSSPLRRSAPVVKARAPRPRSRRAARPARRGRSA